MNDLVQRLAIGTHPVTLGGPAPAAEQLSQRINEIGYVFIRFADTQGGTDLGIRVDRAATDTTHADFTRATGVIHVEGLLTLNSVAVRCIADINLATLSGDGRLIPV